MLSSPGERGALDVYADWLEEQGDPRALYARLQLAAEPDLPALRRACPMDARPWLGPLEAAGAFGHNLLSGIPSRWWGPALPGDPVDQPQFGVFVGRPHAPSLPWPHHRFDGRLAWLADWEPDFAAPPVDARWTLHLRELRSAGYRIPGVFEGFMLEPRHHERLPTTYGLELCPVTDAVPYVQPDGSIALPFVRDAGDHLTWALRLSREDAFHPVIVGVAGGDGPRLQLASLAAPDLESFLYRMLAETALASGAVASAAAAWRQEPHPIG